MKIQVTRDLETCLALRRTVFVQEQNVPEDEERDDKDAAAVHLLAFDGDQPVGTARIVLMGDTGKIGRVCVLPRMRGTGLGVALINAALDDLRARPGMARAKLASQTHAIGFYEKLGFSAHGDEYLDAGIPHRDMTRDL